MWSEEKSKIARRCGAKHILKSKCTKHVRFGALFEVEMLNNCAFVEMEGSSQQPAQSDSVTPLLPHEAGVGAAAAGFFSLLFIVSGWDDYWVVHDRVARAIGVGNDRLLSIFNVKTPPKDLSEVPPVAMKIGWHLSGSCMW